MSDKKAKDDFSLDQSLKELREILDKMQTGNLDFDENVQLFTRGASLIKASRAYLDKSELLIEELIEEELGEDSGGGAE